jgi:riboflavin synthase
MFTGIVEKIGRVMEKKKEQDNIHFSISSSFISELKVDQSIAHNGVCLTVTHIFDTHYSVTAIAETLQKTNLVTLQVGDEINLERCLKIGDRLDGHLVQGHVDTIAKVINIKEENGSWVFRFQFNKEAGLTVHKGSICVNGVSLTVIDASPGAFSVAIIPFTYQNTNFRLLKNGDIVNLEFDIIGKYIAAIAGNSRM